MWWVSSALLILVLISPVHAGEVRCEEEFVPAGGSYDFTRQTDRNYTLDGVESIGKLHITSLDVFDESNERENNRLYRLANRIHVNTRPKLINDLLLIEEEQDYEPRLIEESARLLRSQDYLYDADIRPVRVCDKTVDLEVVTRDVWSLTVDLSFDRAGGESKFGLGIRETNLTGWGNELSIKRKEDDERDTTEVAYKDDTLRGTRLKTRLRYADSDDGSDQFALLELPFYSLDARRAWTISLRNTEQVDTQYFRGEDVSEVQHEFESYRLSYGLSRGLVDGVARRWALGYWYRTSEFSPADELPPPAVFPGDRALSFPYLEYSSVEDRYVERVNVDQFERVEDLHVGRRFYTRIGYSAESFGGDEDRLVYEGRFSDTLFYNRRHFIQHEVSFSGLRNREESRTEDLLVDYELRYILTASRWRSYLLDFHAVYSKNLNANQQILLGGDTGLRAYEKRFQTGDRKFSLNLERRTFTDIHLFNLVRVGWAFFVDVGRAWTPGEDIEFEDDYLANVGFGLRLSSSKADVGRFLHIDVAFPLTNRNDPDVDSSLLSVRLTDKF
jgi:hypothetical protein